MEQDGSNQQRNMTDRQSWQSRTPFFYGWVIVVVAFMMSFMTAGVFWATSVIAIAMREDLGWSLSSIYLGLTIRGLVGAAAAPVLGRFADLKHGSRILGVLSGAISAASLAQESEFDVDEGATKAKIKSAFVKSLKTKKLNKKVLGEFIELVA